MSDELLSTPLILLATIWVSASPVLSANETLHDQRDIVLGIRELGHLSPEVACIIRRSSFRNSYVPLWLGILMFLALMTVFIGFTAGTIALPKDQESHRWLCYSVMLMPMFMFCGFLIGGILDISTMRRLLRREESKLKASPCGASELRDS
jgi:hypothetical protein